MGGLNCPNCHQPSEWLSTIAVWVYYCSKCQIRFSADSKVYSGDCDACGLPVDVMPTSKLRDGRVILQAKGPVVYRHNSCG